MEIGTIFMFLGNEYKIIFKNDKIKRINIEPIGDNDGFPNIRDVIRIKDDFYRVIYIHKIKKRISLDQIEKKGAE